MCACILCFCLCAACVVVCKCHHMSVFVRCALNFKHIFYVVAFNLLHARVCVCWQSVCYVLIFFFVSLVHTVPRWICTICLGSWATCVWPYACVCVCVVRTWLQVCDWVFNFVPCLHFLCYSQINGKQNMCNCQCVWLFLNMCFGISSCRVWEVIAKWRTCLMEITWMNFRL